MRVERASIDSNANTCIEMHEKIRIARQQFTLNHCNASPAQIHPLAPFLLHPTRRPS